MSLYGFDGTNNSFGGIDVFSTRNSGMRVSDTAGLISTPNALVGYRSFTSGGGVDFVLDVSRTLDLYANQRLWFSLTGDFHSNDASFTASGLTPGQANAKAASTQTNIYTVSASANYMVNNYYFRGRALLDFNHADITNNLFIPGAQGATNGRGYSLDATLGGLFALTNTMRWNPATVVKAPPTSPGGYAVLLDTSGHYAYVQRREDAFTDTTGFVYGAEHLSYSDIGAHARLLAVVPDRGFAWLPFVGLSIDQKLGISSTFDIPAQAALPADTLFFAPNKTFWSAEAGLELFNSKSTKFGVKAFYLASADTQTVGGSVILKIPFDQMATTKDSGIRIIPRTLLPVKAPPPPPLPAFWNWAGLYIGGHAGGALSTTKFSDPFGTPIYGDVVRSPGFFGGAQIGYNWQPPSSPWVLGVEADASLMSSDGDATCALLRLRSSYRPHAGFGRRAAARSPAV